MSDSRNGAGNHEFPALRDYRAVTIKAFLFLFDYLRCEENMYDFYIAAPVIGVDIVTRGRIDEAIFVLKRYIKEKYDGQEAKIYDPKQLKIPNAWKPNGQDVFLQKTYWQLINPNVLSYLISGETERVERHGKPDMPLQKKKGFCLS